MPFLLSDYLVKYNIGYNASEFIFDKSYFTTILSDYIVDLKNKITFKLPFHDSIYLKNKDILTTLQASYCILDIKVKDELQKNYYLLYSINNSVLFSKIEKNKIIKTKFVYSYNDPYKKNILSLCLNNEGNGIFYTTKTKNCLQEYLLF